MLTQRVSTPTHDPKTPSKSKTATRAYDAAQPTQIGKVSLASPRRAGIYHGAAEYGSNNDASVTGQGSHVWKELGLMRSAVRRARPSVGV